MDSVVGLDFFQEKKQKEESAMKGPWNLHEAEIRQKNQIDNQHRLFG